MMSYIGIRGLESLGYRRKTGIQDVKANSRRQRNLIEGILDGYNIWKDEPEEVEVEFINYF